MVIHQLKTRVDKLAASEKKYFILTIGKIVPLIVQLRMAFVLNARYTHFHSNLLPKRCAHY